MASLGGEYNNPFPPQGTFYYIEHKILPHFSNTPKGDFSFLCQRSLIFCHSSTDTKQTCLKCQHLLNLILSGGNWEENVFNASTIFLTKIEKTLILFLIYSKRVKGCEQAPTSCVNFHFVHQLGFLSFLSCILLHFVAFCCISHFELSNLSELR